MEKGIFTSPAETSPANPASGFDLAASDSVAAAMEKKTMATTFTTRISVTLSRDFSISQAGVLDTNMPT